MVSGYILHPLNRYLVRNYDVCREDLDMLALGKFVLNGWKRCRLQSTLFEDIPYTEIR